MLAVQKQIKYFSRIMTRPDGSQVLVVFELIERNEHLVARAVYAEALDADTVPEQKVYALPGVKSPTEFVLVKSIFGHFVSIFSKDFSFMTCSIARAPNF